jgi:hypothetical protein
MADQRIDNDNKVIESEPEVLGDSEKLETVPRGVADTALTSDQGSTTLNQFRDPLAFLHLRFTKADDTLVIGGICMYWKVEFLTAMDDLCFRGGKISRPAGTVIRPGDEVFVYSSKRADSYAGHQTFIAVGFFPTFKNPQYSNVLMVVDDFSPDEKDPSKIFRSSPLNFVGLVPEGRCIDSTKPLLATLSPLCRQLVDQFLVDKPLSSLDFFDSNASEQSQTNTQRAKRNSSKKHKLESGSVHVILPKKVAIKKAEPEAISYGNLLQSIQRLERKVDELGKDKGKQQQKDLAQISKLNTQVSKLTAQNKLSGEQLEQLSHLNADFQETSKQNLILQEENSKLKAEKEELSEKLLSKQRKVQNLKQELKIFKEIFQSSTTKHKKKTKQHLPKKTRKQKRSSSEPDSDSLSSSSNSN